VGWQAAAGLTFLAEDAVEGIFTWFGWWRDGQLDVHQLGPSRIRVDTELLNTFLNAEVHVIDGVVERWDHHEDGQDGKGRAGAGHANDQFRFAHTISVRREGADLFL